MSGFQRYLFRNVLRTLIAIVGGLALIALLTQGLSTTGLQILENRQSMLVYFWVSILATPQIVSLLMPIALFIATAGALNVAHRENEVAVAQASGMSNWEVASPVIRLAMLAAILHLGLNLWIQPAASRELRETVTEASTDLAASLVREGMFVQHGDGLTTWAREVIGAEMHDLVASDGRNPQERLTYIAKTAFLVEIEGAPVLLMRDGHIQRVQQNGSLQFVSFDQYSLDLAPFVNDQKAVIMEESDRYLPDLFMPDMTNHYDHKNRNLLVAEGHARLATPLLNFAMALLAIYAVLGGDFSRRGYARRIAIASAAALAVRLAAFGAQAAARDDPAMNFLQYLVPILIIAAISFLHFGLPVVKRRRAHVGGRAFAGAA
jgi:lipopolysaccharide export system permease protein